MPLVTLERFDLMVLGGFAGAQLLVVFFSLLIAGAYRERALLLHSLAVLLGLLAQHAGVMPWPAGFSDWLPDAAMLCALAASAFVLRDLVNHAGAMRRMRMALIGVSLALPVLAALQWRSGWTLLLPGTAIFAAVLLPVMLRAWLQSQPWVQWLGVGLPALLVAAISLGGESLGLLRVSPLRLGAALALWSAATYLAIVWRSRMFAETRVRVDAMRVTDALTGLSTPPIFADRVEAARAILRRYGHPSVLLLVEIENLGALAQEFGPEVAEGAVLAAASRIRQALGGADVAARISHARIAVLAEGVSVADGAATVGTRILVAGLKEPLQQAPTEFLNFRMVVAALPAEAVAPKALLGRLGTLLDRQLMQATERRIHTVTTHELLGR